MVQINLLPVAEKGKYKAKMELALMLRPIVVILIAVMLAIMAFWAILGIQFSTKAKRLSQLNEQLKSFNFILQKLDALKKDKEEFTGKLEFMSQWAKRENIWARNLNRLSNLVPHGIWLRGLALNTTKGGLSYKNEELHISGSAISLKGEAMIDLITKFLSALKKDQIFSEQFSEINLVSSTRRKTGKFEIMDFKLLCNFQ